MVLSGGGSANEVGVIVRVGREDFTVINNHGIVREVRPEELRGKRNASSNRGVALDVQGNQIRVGDAVNVAEGPHKGKTATIKRMSRAQLFLYSQTRSEHAGIFVVRSRSCVLAGSRSQNRGNAVDARASPFSTPQSQAGGGGPMGGRGESISPFWWSNTCYVCCLTSASCCNCIDLSSCQASATTRSLERRSESRPGNGKVTLVQLRMPRQHTFKWNCILA